MIDILILTEATVAPYLPYRPMLIPLIINYIILGSRVTTVLSKNIIELVFDND